jgi:hypothetical protein
MPPFWSFWEKAQDQAHSEQVRLFKHMVVKEHPELYNEGVLGVGSDASNLDVQITDFLRDAPRDVAAMRETSDALDLDLSGYLGEFKKAFPDFRCESPIYFLVSLSAFDGAVRSVNGTPALLFGVDVIAAIHPRGELGVLLTHELFHAYRRQVTGRTTAGMGAPLYLALWEEGLATYVSEVLNPKASESEVLGRPKDLAQKTRPLLPRIAREMLQNMDSTSPEVYEGFFLGHTARNDMPPRSGYYVGLLVARDLGKNRSLQVLARMDGGSLRASVRRVLEDIANRGNELNGLSAY